MLQSSIIEGTNVVAATYRGSLGADDMDKLRADLSEAAARGPVQLLIQYEDIDLGRIEPEALWKDVKTAGRLNDIERCAVVTDGRVIEAFAGAAAKVAPFEVRQFGVDQRDEAVAWLTS